MGEAPGELEDETGTCFVGPSGQLLTQAIQEYALKPCRITNAVRCRPPSNRNPKPDEIKACKPYLMEEIEKYKPEIIVTLGNIPLRALTGKTGVNTYAGSIVGEIAGAQIYSLYHPSYVLRYPAHKYKFEAHLLSLQRMLTGAKALGEVERVEVVKPETALLYLSEAKTFVTFDFETTGEYKQYGGKIRCIAFTTEQRTFAVEAGQAGFRAMMQSFLKSDIRKCAFNCIFESRWCLDEFGVEPKNLTYDPYLMHYLFDENAAHGLDSVASQILQRESWDIAPLMKTNKWDWKDVPMNVLIKYCGQDTHNTYQLVRPLGEKLKEQGLVNYYVKILLPLAKLCARLAVRGLKIDIAHARKWQETYMAEADNTLKELIRLGNLPEDFNPNSPAQIAKALKKLKINTGEKTDGGEMSVAAAALEALEDSHPFVKTYLAWKEKKILSNNFLEEYPRLVDCDVLIHPSFNPARIVTGRIACSEPSAQNVPKDENVRGMIISRFEGGKILENDYGQLEYRLMASESGEERMLKLFEMGVDLHDEKAKELFGENFDDFQRKIAKTVNFGTAYGVSGYTLSKKFNLPREVAEGILLRDRSLNPNLYGWMRDQHDQVKRKGFLSSRFGQRRRLPDAQLSDKWIVERACRQAGNFPIQAQGATITNLAAVLIDKETARLGLRSVVCHIIHDAILLDVYPGEPEDVLRLCKQIMTVEMKKYTPWLKVALTIDQKISDRWGGKNKKETTKC